MVREETKHYKNILEITNLIRKKERIVTGLLLFGSLLATLTYYKLFTYDSIFLVAVLFYGLAVSLIFKRDMDVKLGGLSSFALLLYYSLGNLWLPLHFLVVWAIGIPVAIFLTRRGLLGALLFYGLSLVILPLSVISYHYFVRNFHYTFLPQTFDAQEVIYIFLPMVYVHTSLSVKSSLILRDTLVFLGLLVFSVPLWWLINFGAHFI